MPRLGGQLHPIPLFQALFSSCGTGLADDVPIPQPGRLLDEVRERTISEFARASEAVVDEGRSGPMQDSECMNGIVLACNGGAVD